MISRPEIPTLGQWWRHHFVQSVDHVEVMEKVRDEAGWSGRYAFMTLMSAGIAVLGLLLSSPAVVIGAMLISPLMGPIIGMGFALATFDGREMRKAAIALLIGVVLAVLFSALVAVLSPLQNVTEEIASRTRPNLFDLMVALFSALAGAYAMVRGRAGTVVGVAIATALMPPLSVMGFGLATMNGTVLAGSTLLFVTNLMTIAIAAAVVARAYGFGAHLTPQHTLLQTVLVVSSLVALAVPLGISLRQIAWETAAAARAREVVVRQFGAGARLSQIDVAFDLKPMRVRATVMTPRFSQDAERKAETALGDILGRPVQVELEQLQVGTGAEAEAEQIASAQAGRANLAERQASELVDRLATIAGVSAETVVIDREHRRVAARATALPGAGFAAYRTLEARVSAGAPGWSVELVPPLTALAPVSFDGEAPDAAGRAALADAAWAAKRLGLPIGVAGSDDRVAAVLGPLNQAGVRALPAPGPGSGEGSGVRLRWFTPEAP